LDSTNFLLKPGRIPAILFLGIERLVEQVSTAEGMLSSQEGQNLNKSKIMAISGQKQISEGF